MSMYSILRECIDESLTNKQPSKTELCYQNAAQIALFCHQVSSTDSYRYMFIYIVNAFPTEKRRVSSPSTKYDHVDLGSNPAEDEIDPAQVIGK